MYIKEKLKKFNELRSEHYKSLKRAIEDGEFDEDATAKAQALETLEKIKGEMDELAQLIEEIDEPADGGGEGEEGRGFNPLATTELRSLGGMNFNNNRGKNMNEKISAEVRSLQRFVAVGANGMTAEERSGLNISGAAAVLPTEIYNELITNEKYSDLLKRAKVFNEGGAGKLYIPVASDTAASWHTELAGGTDTAPTLTKIELGGYELMRLMSMSAAVESMTEVGFKQSMLQLLGSEVVETLEYSFVNGTGSGQPKGLANLTWTTSGSGKNAIVTEETSTSGVYRDISFKDIAEALSMLPQKYARGAILLMNASVAYNTIAAADDSNGQPIFNMGEAAETVLGHEIVISEHVPANTIFVVDPAELYVRFSMPLQIESDRSSGFTSATTNMRALCVVDAAWNPAACVRITKGAASA